jgi:ribosomal protein S18 acetylase RimI-like enzyme
MKNVILHTEGMDGLARLLSVRFGKKFKVLPIVGPKECAALEAIDSVCFPEDLANDAEEFAEVLEMKGAFGYLVVCEKTAPKYGPAGYVLGSDDKEDIPLKFHEGSLYMNSVTVMPAFRGRGVSREMHKVFEEEARMRGAKNLFLHTLPEFEAFFGKLGYARQMIAEDYYDDGEHAVLMKKGLAVPAGSIII